MKFNNHFLNNMSALLGHAIVAHRDGNFQPIRNFFNQGDFKYNNLHVIYCSDQRIMLVNNCILPMPKINVTFYQGTAFCHDESVSISVIYTTDNDIRTISVAINKIEDDGETFEPTLLKIEYEATTLAEISKLRVLHMVLKDNGEEFDRLTGFYKDISYRELTGTINDMERSSLMGAYDTCGIPRVGAELQIHYMHRDQDGKPLTTQAIDIMKRVLLEGCMEKDLPIKES